MKIFNNYLRACYFLAYLIQVLPDRPKLDVSLTGFSVAGFLVLSTVKQFQIRIVSSAAALATDVSSGDIAIHSIRAL